ncbi:MAG: hypothetical protein ABJC98_22420 [Bacteroidota bacterium]
MRSKFTILKYPPAILLLLIFLSGYNLVIAQLTIQFMPALNGRSVNGLFTAQIYNTSTLVYNGKIKITVVDGSNKTILRTITPSILIKPGTNLILPLASQSAIQFGNTSAADIVAQTGRFPENEYDYCFEFTGKENKTSADEQVFENCFNYLVQPLIPLSLIYPGDGDMICNTRPEFTWQPAMPMISSNRYRIIVTEKMISQPAADALMNNVPVFQQDNIAANMLLYPPQVPDLQKQKEYVWQVIAYEGSTKVTQSEIWVFNINCNEKKPDSSKESYRQLSGVLNGNYYMAKGMLRVSFNNPYGLTNVQYSITGISDPGKKISNLPSVKAQTGLNKIDIELEDVKGIQENKTYLLKIENIGDHILFLQFIYKGNEDW